MVKLLLPLLLLLGLVILVVKGCSLRNNGRALRRVAELPPAAAAPPELLALASLTESRVDCHGHCSHSACAGVRAAVGGYSDRHQEPSSTATSSSASPAML
jgi:hypothetical protein